MIYIFVGNDNKNKKIKLKTLTKNREVVVVPEKDLNELIILDYANTRSLFGEQFVIVIDNLISRSEVILSKDQLENIKNSETIFVLLEDKLLAADVKKYSKYAEIENFDEKVNKVFKNDSFIIADYFASRDKIKTWVAYNEAIDKGITGEALAGIIFWKIKNMKVNGSNVFTSNELKSQSSRLVSLYHKAHNGECDITIGLEQFMLSVLNK